MAVGLESRGIATWHSPRQSTQRSASREHSCLARRSAEQRRLVTTSQASLSKHSPSGVSSLSGAHLQQERSTSCQRVHLSFGEAWQVWGAMVRRGGAQRRARDRPDGEGHAIAPLGLETAVTPRGAAGACEALGPSEAFHTVRREEVGGSEEEWR